jgi:FkbM family methyltransferase
MNLKRNLVELFQYIETLGWTSGLSIFAKVKFNSTESIKLKHIKYPFKLRSGSSDINAFRQVFIYNEYNFEVTEPSFIVDGGSNIGLAAIYFANKFPMATIVSIEPEIENFKLLLANTNNYSSIHPLQSGIWSSSTFLKVRNIGLGNWGFIVEEQQHEDEDTFSAISISDILQKFNKTRIDILKLDVEGAEKEIFSSNYQDWLPNTKVLIVELHDRMKKDCSKALFKALLNYDFTVEQLGENLVCVNQQLNNQ